MERQLNKYYSVKKNQPKTSSVGNNLEQPELFHVAGFSLQSIWVQVF
jgi:hypothetical protein